MEKEVYDRMVCDDYQTCDLHTLGKMISLNSMAAEIDGHISHCASCRARVELCLDELSVSGDSLADRLKHLRDTLQNPQSLRVFRI